MAARPRAREKARPGSETEDSLGIISAGTSAICGAIMLSCAISILNRQALPIDYDIVLFLVAFLFLLGNTIFTGYAGFLHPAMLAAYGFFGVWYQLGGIQAIWPDLCTNGR